MPCTDCGGKEPPRYTHTVTVEKLNTSAASDANGQLDPDDDDNWTAEGRLRVRFITPSRTSFITKSGREVQVGNQIQALASVVIMTPFTSDSKIPNPSKRLRMGTRVFNIIYSARVNESEREVQIEAIERK